MDLPKTYIKGYHYDDKVNKMKYNQLGNTDMKVSRIGLGGGAMSGFYNEFEDEEAIQTVIEAVKSGINYIDTAPYYGEGRSETLLGKALKHIPRESYYLSTKVGRYSKQWDKMFNYSAEKITSGFQNSLHLLGIDYVDILVVHDIEFADLKQIIEETLPAVKKLKDAGKVRYIAVSGYPVSRLWEGVEKSQHIPIDIILSYSRDTLIDKTLQEYIPRFKSKGLGIINAAPTAMSMLTNYGPQPWHPANERTKQICHKAQQYCKDNGVELGRLSMYHTLQTPECHNVLVGMNTREILKSNLTLLFDGLSEKEKQVLQYLKDNVFPKDENLHWEGIEIAEYRRQMKNINKE